jgi:hypothetical protein
MWPLGFCCSFISSPLMNLRVICYCMYGTQLIQSIGIHFAMPVRKWFYYSVICLRTLSVMEELWMTPPRPRARFLSRSEFSGHGLKKSPHRVSLALRLRLLFATLRLGRCRVGSRSRPVSDGRPGFGDFLNLHE